MTIFPCNEAPPPLTPPLKGEGVSETSATPSPLSGGGSLGSMGAEFS
jgi:hypothetical protein